MISRGRSTKKYCSPCTRFSSSCMAWLSVFTFILPLPAMPASAGDGPVPISIIAHSDGGSFTSAPFHSTASLTAKVADPATGQAVNGATVTWFVESAHNSSSAMASGWGGKKTGLAWGTAPEAGLTHVELSGERITSDTINNTSTTNAFGETTKSLTDIVGQRTITVKATVTVDSMAYSATQVVSFGDGPLSVFKAPVYNLTFEQAYNECNGVERYVADGVAPSTWSILAQGDYVGGGKIPSRVELQRVSNTDTQWGATNPENGLGAAYAAGWSGYWYWTGEVRSTHDVFGVVVVDGDGGNGGNVGDSGRVACRR